MTRARQFKMTEPSDNRLLTKLDYLESWAFGARVLALRPAFSVGVDPMALDPEEFITLTRSRLAESARGSIARDDVAAQVTQADNNRPRG